MAAENGGDLSQAEMSELEKLQLKINEKSDETLDCTRRMREMCSEAKDAGMKTLIALDDQEELIDKFESAADNINADMALAEKALKARLTFLYKDQTVCKLRRLVKPRNTLKANIFFPHM